MGSAKVIMSLLVWWKKPIKPLTELNPEDVENAEDMDCNIGDSYIKVELPFNSVMAKFFDGRDIGELIQDILAHIKIQVENPQMTESGFKLDKIMHLDINFHRQALTWGSSYNELQEWIESKKAVINSQNKDEECFKWAVIAALHHKEIKNRSGRISLLEPYENQCNWERLEFTISIKKIDKFEKNNPDMAVNVSFNNKKNQKKNI